MGDAVSLTPMMREVLGSVLGINDRKPGLGALFYPGFESALEHLKSGGFITSPINGYFITPAGRSALESIGGDHG